MTFKYIIQTPYGVVKNGTIDIDSLASAQQKLQDEGNFVISIKVAQKSLISRFNDSQNQNLKPKQKAFLFRQLSYLTETGYSLESSLNKLLFSNKTPNWTNVLGKLCVSVQDSGSLSGALEELKIFESDVIYQVAAGEVSGTLAEVLMTISKTFESSTANIRSIQILLVYPAILLVILFSGTYLVSSMVIPKITSLMLDVGVEMPLISKIVISTSNFLTKYGLVLTIGIVLIVLICRALLFRPAIRYKYDKTLLRIPVIGILLVGMEVVKYSKVFAATFDSGVELENVMYCSARTIKNKYLHQRALECARKVIEDGTSLPEAVAYIGMYTDDEIQLIEIGSDTDRVSEAFSTLSARAAEDLDVRIKAAMGLIEPLSIVILGVVIGFFLMGIYSPMYSIISNAQY